MYLLVCFPAPFFHDLSLFIPQGEHLGITLQTTEKMMSSSYSSEMSSSSCGTQQSPEVLPCQPQHYHCYRQTSQAQQPPEKNIVYQRVRTYSGPMNKVVQTLDPVGSGEVLSPLKTASSYQSLVWSDHSQVPQRQLCQREGNLELVYSLPASLALFYRILSLGLHFYIQYKVIQIPSPGCPFLVLQPFVYQFTNACNHLFISSNDFHNLTRIQDDSFLWNQIGISNLRYSFTPTIKQSSTFYKMSSHCFTSYQK